MKEKFIMYRTIKEKREFLVFAINEKMRGSVLQSFLLNFYGEYFEKLEQVMSFIGVGNNIQARSELIIQLADDNMLESFFNLLRSEREGSWKYIFEAYEGSRVRVPMQITPVVCASGGRRETSKTGKVLPILESNKHYREDSEHINSIISYAGPLSFLQSLRGSREDESFPKVVILDFHSGIEEGYVGIDPNKPHIIEDDRDFIVVPVFSQLTKEKRILDLVCKNIVTFSILNPDHKFIITGDFGCEEFMYISTFIATYTFVHPVIDVGRLRAVYDNKFYPNIRKKPTIEARVNIVDGLCWPQTKVVICNNADDLPAIPQPEEGYKIQGISEELNFRKILCDTRVDTVLAAWLAAYVVHEGKYPRLFDEKDEAKMIEKVNLWARAEKLVK